MTSPATILRIVLALAIGVVPLLCCCPAAAAEGTEPDAAVEADAADHACCVADEEARHAATPDSDHHDCGCEGHLVAAQTPATPLDLHPPVEASATWLTLALLPRPLAAACLDLRDSVRPPDRSEAAAWPAAPTLRTLSVLLLT